jgi:hypothetical protein
MCPFGTKLCSFLLADVGSGRYPAEFHNGASEPILEWQRKMDRAERDTAGYRMALALLTASNAVLGRPKNNKPRTLSETVEQLQQHTDSLTCWKSEQQIMEGRDDDGHTGLVARSAQVLRLARLFNDYNTFNNHIANTQYVELQEYLANDFATTFFSFAQKECTRHGHGIEGLIRAIGIVIGEVSLEEVVFG